MLRQDSTFALRMMRKNLGFHYRRHQRARSGHRRQHRHLQRRHAVLLKPLPYQHGERLLMMRQSTPTSGLMGRNVSVPELMDYRRQNRSLDAIVEYHNMQSSSSARRTRAGRNRVVSGIISTVFGAKPLIGRNFAPTTKKQALPRSFFSATNTGCAVLAAIPRVIGKFSA